MNVAMELFVVFAFLCVGIPLIVIFTAFLSCVAQSAWNIAEEFKYMFGRKIRKWFRGGDKNGRAGENN